MEVRMFRFLVCSVSLLLSLLLVFFESGMGLTPLSAQSERTSEETKALRAAEAAIERLRREPIVWRGLPPSAEMMQRTIDALDSLSLQYPSSNWIAGHRVGLRVMFNQERAALDLARDCGAEVWWCSLLEVYVLHIMQDFESAEAVLGTISDEDRCRWTNDLNLHLPPHVEGAVRNADCATRIELEDRAWRLADPLYLRPGNDFKTEYFARAVEMQLHHEVLALNGHVCSPSHHEMGMNLGWQSWSSGYLDHAFGSDEFTFFPNDSAIRHPLESRFSDWDLRSPGSALRYDPPYGPIHELDSQLGSFLRGDSMHVVAGIELEMHPLSQGRDLQGGLVLMEALEREALEAWTTRIGSRFVVRTTALAASHFIGIEIQTPNEGVARTRYGYHPPPVSSDGFGLSDPLFFEWNDTVREELDEVAPLVLGTTKIRRSQQPGVFWEIYGLGGGEEVKVSAVVEARERGGFFRRVISAIGFAGGSTSVRVEWSEIVGNTDPELLGRAFQLGIGGLLPGGYTLVISVERENGVIARESREFELLED